jgi:membrane-associated protein
MLESIMSALHQLHDPEGLKLLIATFGLWLLVFIVFAETGLLVGFFLPGDSLLFIAGTLCAVNFVDPSAAPPLSFVATVVALSVAAIIGNTLNYWLGRWFGEWVWNRPDGRLIKRRYLTEAHAFYEKYGAVSLVLTRYVPIARTFVPFIAGMSRMNFLRYTLWNIIGGVCWVVSITALGMWLGRMEFVQRNLQLIVLAVIIISILPMVIAGLMRWHRGRAAARAKEQSDAGLKSDVRCPMSDVGRQKTEDRD